MSGGKPGGSYWHASALVIGETGLLITGASGAGKSGLVLALLAQAQAQGHFARLVGDDRVRVEAQGGRLLARAHPAIAGMIELRGAGLLPIESLAAARIHAIIALEEAPERLPEPAALERAVAGITLPCLPLRADADLPAKAGAVLQWLRVVHCINANGRN